MVSEMKSRQSKTVVHDGFLDMGIMMLAIRELGFGYMAFIAFVAVKGTEAVLFCYCGLTWSRQWWILFLPFFFFFGQRFYDAE